MNFKYGDYKGLNDIGKFERRFNELEYTETDKNATLKKIAEKIKKELGLETGEIDLKIVFTYTKKVEE